jgi:UDP-glucuronate decarboxylase
MTNNISEAENDKILQEDLLYIAKSVIKQRGLSSETILVSGATGLMGSLIIKSILCYNRIYNKNVYVIGLARSEEKAKEVFGNSYYNKLLKMVYEDITKVKKIDSKIDYIIHTASATSSKFFVNNPVETIEISFLGTNQILKLAHENSIKSMVYLSSMEMYGKTEESTERITEEKLGYIDLACTRSSYPEGKRISESMCVAYSKQYDVPVKIARLSQTFGAGILPNENRIFAQFAKSVIEKKNIVLHTKGESIGNYCYTRDAIIAIFTLLFKGENGEAYNICNEKSTIKIKDMAEIVCKELGEGTISVLYDIPEDAKTYGYAPDVPLRLSAKKMNALGWSAEISLRESYERMIQSMKSNTYKQT